MLKPQNLFHAVDNLLLFCRAPLYDHSTAVVEGSVYACAGSTEGKASLLLHDNVQCYNPHLNHWDLVAPLQEARGKGASTEHEGLLYVSGKMERWSQIGGYGKFHLFYPPKRN